MYAYPCDKQNSKVNQFINVNELRLINSVIILGMRLKLTILFSNIL